MDCSMPGLPVHHQLPEFTQSHVHQVGDAIQPPHPLLSPSPPAFSLSRHQGLFKRVSSLHQMARVSASASVLLMNILDWFPLRWTGWISLQSKGLSRVFSNTTIQKASILWCSAFFIVQISHPYMTAGKTIALTRQTCVGKVISLLFNMLSRLVITFLPRSKSFKLHGCSHHLQWFWSPAKIKSVTVSIVSPSICHEVMGPDGLLHGWGHWVVAVCAGTFWRRLPLSSLPPP